MGIIQGFYQLRAYSNTNYCLYYSRSGTLQNGLIYMKQDAHNANNYTNWMLWQPSDSNANYVQLVSATNVVYSNKYLYEILSSERPDSALYNVLRTDWTTSLTPFILDEGIEASVDSAARNAFIKTKVGTTTYSGATLDVITLKLPYNSRYLDYSKAIANQNNSVTLESSTGASTQKFVLEPIDPRYDGLVAPTNIYLQTSTSGTSTKTLDWWTTNTLYWQWTDSANTINAGDGHQMSERDVSQNNDGTWNYGSLVGYGSVDVKTSGYKRWRTTKTTIPSCSSSIKQAGKQIYIQTIRKVTALGKTTAFCSPTASQTIKFAKKPTLTKDGLSWTPEGLKVNFTSDYFGQGSMALTFCSVVTYDSKESKYIELLPKDYGVVTVVKDTTVTVPTSYLARPPKDGEQLILHIRVDTDVYAPFNNYERITDTLTYDEGNVNVTPTITKLDGLKYKADVPYANTVKMWMSVDGVNTELTGTVSNGHTIFEIYPPFCTDWGLFTQYENSDKTKWGTDYTEMPKLNIRAHCFTWSGGSVVIWLNKDTALTESFTFSPQSTTHTLAGRSHDVVTYLSDGSKNYTSVTGDIKGYIVPQCETYGTTKESIEALVEQGHVFYRAPYGRCCNVAVTGADITTDKGITEVSISIVQEDDDQENSGGMSELY